MEIERHHFATIGSTNTWAKENAHLFSKKALTVIFADEQTAGRGRFLRRWESPAGQNVYVSFCFFVDDYSFAIGNVPQVLAISSVKVLENLGFSPLLKWPNDVLLSGKKVAGILCETTSIDDKVCVIVGIGINVNMPQEALKTIDRPATSLLEEGHKSFSVTDVLTALEEQFEKDLVFFSKKGFSPFLSFYREKIGGVKKIAFDDSQIVWKGEFHSIEDNGSLNMTLDDGRLKNFIAGEILWE